MVHYKIDKAEPKFIRKTFEKEGIMPVNEAREGDDTYEVCVMSEGDIVVEEKSVGLERKTESDLWESIKDGRAKKQLLRMLNKFEVPILCVTSNSGGINKLKSFVNHKTGQDAVKPTLAMLASVVTRYVKKDEAGHVVNYVRVFMGLTTQQMVQLLRFIVDKAGKRPITVDEVRPVEKNLGNAPLQMVMGIPGVRRVVANNLLEKFGSVNGVGNATEEELRGVDKVGEVKASVIFDAFRTRYVKPQERKKGTKK